MSTCTISGTLKAVDGSPLADVVLKVYGIVPQGIGSTLVSPKLVEVTADEDGLVEFEVERSTRIRLRCSEAGLWDTLVTVPNAPTAFLATLVNQANAAQGTGGTNHVTGDGTELPLGSLTGGFSDGQIVLAEDEPITIAIDELNAEVKAVADSVDNNAGADDATELELGTFSFGTGLTSLSSSDSTTEAVDAVNVAAKTAVDSEATTRGNADTVLSNSIDAEETARTAADVVLTTAISDEASTRATADTNEAAARTTADADLQSQIDAIDSVDTAAIDAEEAARIAADDSLSTAIDAEETARAAADTTLQTNITAEATARGTAVSNEAVARAAADADLQDQIDDLDPVGVQSQIDALTAADTALSTAISAEATARGTAVSDEATARAAADTDLQGQIDVVSTDLDALEDTVDTLSDTANTLTTNLAAEATTRGNADTVLSNSIDAEEAARIAADAVLQGEIDTTNANLDAMAAGLVWKPAVRAATTAAITRSGEQTIDGVSVVAGDRVLVKNQGSPAQNGIYVAASGAWSRASDMDSSVETIANAAVFVEEGSVNADSGWTLVTNEPIVLDVTTLTFTQFTALGMVTAGIGLTKTGSVIDVDFSSSTPQAVGTTGVVGTSEFAARDDHVHALTFTTINTLLATANAAINLNGQDLVNIDDVTAANLGLGLTADVARFHMLSEASNTTPTEFTADDFVVGRTDLTDTTSGAIFFRYDSTNNVAFMGALSPGFAWRDLKIGASNVIFQSPSGVAKLTISNSSGNVLAAAGSAAFGWEGNAFFSSSAPGVVEVKDYGSGAPARISAGAVGSNPSLFVASPTDYPGLFIKSDTPTGLNGAPWQGASAMITCDAAGGGGNIWTALAVNGLGDISAATYSEAALNIGVWGDSEGGVGATHPIGTLGTSVHATLGAGVAGVRAGVGSLNLTTISTLAAGSGVFGYSDLTAGVFGYTPTADLPGVLGFAAHADGVGMVGATANTPSLAAQISSWSGAGVVGLSGEAGHFGVGGEYLNTSVYGEGIEGFNAANGSGVAGYRGNGGSGNFSMGVIGAIHGSRSGGAGVVGYKGLSNFTLALTDTDFGGAGVFGASGQTAGVYGRTLAASVPGVKGVGYSSGTASRGVEARAGTTTGSALLAVSGSPTIDVEAIAATWRGATIIGLADTAAGGDIWGCLGLELFGAGGGEVIEAYAHSGTGVAGYTETTNAGIMGHAINIAGTGVLGVAGTAGGLQATGFNATSGAGVGGYATQVAGVYGVSGAAGVPGVKGSAYATPTAQSRGVEGRTGIKGFGVLATTALSTVVLATELANWDSAASFSIADSDADSGIWVAHAAWAYSTSADVWGAYMGTDKGIGIQGEALGGTNPAGVVGKLAAAITTGGAVVGVKGGGGTIGTALALAGASGVFGYSDLTAGVYGYSYAGGVSGVVGRASAGNARGGEFYGHGTYAGAIATGGATDGPGVVGIGGASSAGAGGEFYGGGGIAAGVYAQGTLTGVGGWFVGGDSNGSGGVYASPGAVTNGYGVSAESKGNAHAIYGWAPGSGAGVYGDASGGTGYGVIAEADPTTPVKAAMRLVGQDTAPSSPDEGAVYYNSVTKKHYGYNGSGWQAFY